MSGRAVRPSRSTSCWGCGPGASRPPWSRDAQGQARRRPAAPRQPGRGGRCLLDGQRLVDASDLLVVSLPTLANKADSEALFRIILSDVGHWITRKGGRPGLVTVDEFGSLDGGRGNRRRPAGARLISLRPHRARRAVLPLARRRGHLGSPYLQRRRPGLVRSATPDELVRLAGTVLEAEAGLRHRGWRLERPSQPGLPPPGRSTSTAFASSGSGKR